MRTSLFRKILCKIIIIFLLCFLLQAHSHALPQYILEDLGYGAAKGINESGQVVGGARYDSFLWENGSMTFLDMNAAVDINESGQIAGSSDGKEVLWDNGSLTDLGTSSLDSSAMAINNKAQIVGYQQTTDAGNPYHAWLWDPVNKLQDIDTTGYSSAYDINDNEIVVGRFGSPAHYPAIWQNGVMTQIGSSEGQAQGINNLDQVVGAYAGHAFLWDNGSLTDLGTIGTANSDAKAINENGQVVGQLTFPGGVERAMFWQNNQIFDLNDLISSDSDFVLTNAWDINNKGQIVGRGIIGGEGHAFLLTPISEPLVSCVNTAGELQTSLVQAANNGRPDIIHIVQGTYVGNFVYTSTEPHGLTIEGGYNSDCTARGVDPTVLDGDNSGRVLALDCSGVAADLVVDGITIQNGNVTGTQGAGLVVRTNGNAVVENNKISKNVHNNSSGAGAAIIAHGIVNIKNNVFSNNVGSVAGLLVSFAEELSIVSNIITNNTSSGYGGAVVSENKSITLSNNTISNNTGDGLFIVHGESLNFTKNKVNDNSGQGMYIVEVIDIFMDGNEISGHTSNYGGGIWIRGKVGGSQSVTMINNVIVNNTAVYDGGGIIMMEDLGFRDGVLKQIFLINNTIVDNQAGGNGGGLYIVLENNSSISSIYNNIILNNDSNLGDDLYIDNNPHGNPTPSGSVNLYNNDFDKTNGFFIKVDDSSVVYSDNLNNLDPKFDTDGYHLTGSSPLIDAGVDAGVYDDIDGDLRPQPEDGNYDIGADEYVISDLDGDGIPDDQDACPNSDLSETVVIDGWDTGVGNVLIVDGCTISDLISECADKADNHGEFVSAVSHTTNSLKKEGIISGKDKGRIQKGAAKAAIP